jgi:hypothetical protein
VLPEEQSSAAQCWLVPPAQLPVVCCVELVVGVELLQLGGGAPSGGACLPVAVTLCMPEIWTFSEDIPSAALTGGVILCLQLPVGACSAACTS